MQTIPLLDGGLLHYDPAFLPADEAATLFAVLMAETPWAQEGTGVRRFPRLTAWYANPGLTYTYSGVTHHATPWTPTLAALKTRLEAVAGTTWNSMLLNWYRDGSDSIGFHTDAEPELGVNPIIGSLSLGSPRRFIMKHMTSDAQHEFALGHGSLLIMGGTSQHHWRHGVPKTKQAVGPRINLTLRQISA